MNYIKLTILSLMALTLVSLAPHSEADDTKDFVAVVDIQRVLQESKASTGIREQIKEKRDKYQEDIAKQEDELREADQKLGEQRSILSPEAFNEKKNEFKEKLIKVQRDVQEKRAKLDAALNKSLGEVQKAVYDIIADMSDDKGFRIAIPTAQILYAEKNLDITDDVLKKLNKKLPKVEVKTE